MNINLTNEQTILLLNSISQDNMKYTLNGICIDTRTDTSKINVVTIDGRVMTRITLEQDDIIPDKMIIVKPPSIKKSERISFNVSDEEIIISVYNKKDELVRKETGEVIEGKFPNWQMFIPNKDIPVFKTKFNPSFLSNKFFYECSFPVNNRACILAIPSNDYTVNNTEIVFMPMRMDDAGISANDMIKVYKGFSNEERKIFDEGIK